ncbi:MAG: 1,4-alpha-glucan branching enzyme [Firmicutes bacterium HGW-Firmicutes-1]|nr:MAG: 1,4-alpha-glucan branching enzyme [Firmicutes bacterium HGW-Firmicutes-1]
MKNNISKAEINEIIESNHRDPHHILGLHKSKKNKYIINTFQPHAKHVKVIVLDEDQETQVEMVKVADEGFFTIELDAEVELKYKLLYEGFNGDSWEMYDPYSFSPIISDLDMHLFGNGTHYEIYNKLGAHVLEVNGVKGVHFAVWAPNAKRVSVIGDFCGWDGRIYPMRLLGQSGIYELFVPGLDINTKYKFEIKTREDYLLKKSDPYGNYAEMRPDTASIVTDVNSYKWKDTKWMKKRDSSVPYNKPTLIYEVHLGSWKKPEDGGFLNYRQLAHELVDYVKEMGYTHIQLMPIAEHPFDGSWGYQVIGYFATTSRFGTPEDFMYFVDYCHNNEISVLLDWVPAHFPKDGHGLIRFDGTALYEHEDPKQGEHPHWGTMIFNFERNEVVNFLVANAFYWLDIFHIDGLRVDAVASMLYLDYGKEYNEWIPNVFGGRENLAAVEFFKHLNSIIYQKYQGILMIAEESTSWAGVSRPTDVGGLGFGMKWNMGWMNDFLRYIEKEPIHRKYHHNDLTFSMVYAYTENFILVLSHDEVVHGKGSMITKMPGDYWQKFANLRAAYGFMYGHPGKKLSFMGNEIAQFDEWSEDKSIDWHLLQFDKHQQLQNYMKELNHLYLSEKAFWYDDFSPKGFEWINCSDSEASIISYVRKTDKVKDTIVVVANFTPVPRTLHKIGVPYKGTYKEIFNSDDLRFGGSGLVNSNILSSADEEWDGREQNIGLIIPPLATVILKYIG